MYFYFHKGVFLAAFSSQARLPTVPAPTSHDNEHSAEIKVLAPQILPPVKTQLCISNDLRRDLDVAINVLTALHLSQAVQWLPPHHQPCNYLTGPGCFFNALRGFLIRNSCKQKKILTHSRYTSAIWLHTTEPSALMAKIEAQSNVSLGKSRRFQSYRNAHFILLSPFFDIMI